MTDHNLKHVYITVVPLLFLQWEKILPVHPALQVKQQIVCCQKPASELLLHTWLSSWIQQSELYHSQETYVDQKVYNITNYRLFQINPHAGGPVFNGKNRKRLGQINKLALASLISILFHWFYFAALYFCFWPKVLSGNRSLMDRNDLVWRTNLDLHVCMMIKVCVNE